MNSLAKFGPPEGGDDLEIVHGLTHAIEVMCQPTDMQSELRDSEETDIENKGRIICVSSHKK